MRYFKVILLISIFFACRKEAKVLVEYIPDTNFTIDLDKAEYMAGEAVSFSIETSVSQPFQVLFSGVFIDEVIESKHGVYTLSKRLSRKAGKYTLSVLYEGQKYDPVNFEIHPLHANGKISSFTGPKKIPSNASKPSMAVFIPTDKYNNALEDGAIIEMSADFNGKKTVENLVNNNLLSYYEMSGKDALGKVQIGALIDNANSSVQEIIVDETWPTTFTIKPVKYIPEANFSEFVHLQTSKILDVHDAYVPNGTTVKWFVTNAKMEYSEYTSLTVNGVSEVFIKNPKVADNWKVVAQIEGVDKSNIIDLDFIPSIDSYEITKYGNTIKFGPIYGKLGQLIHNGFPVECRIRVDKETIVKIGFTDDGYYEYNIPKELESKSLQCLINIGGIIKSFEI